MKKYFIGLIAATILVACSSVKTSFDYDKQADFTKYKTYQLSKETMSMDVNQLDRDRIVAAVENQMTAEGFKKSDTPDVIINVHIKTAQEVSATATTTGGGYGYGYRYGYAGGFSTTQVSYNEYTVGTMFISMVDMSMEKIVWQGVGTKTLAENASADKKESNINYAVKAIFESYPPVK
ncbi:MAG: DUF4136 domain-containing protein [Bacteroidia bacterium]|nr:MAG: DUF4136 domain-containing protein [Bacteroidia bacterium]